MKNTKKCRVIKNPCLVCYEPVTTKTGLQCKGACQRWAHFKCLDYTPGKIQDVRSGTIQVNCPCPLCDTKGPKEIFTHTHKCNNRDCPGNNPPKCPGSRPPSPYFTNHPPSLPKECVLPKCPGVNTNKSNSSCCKQNPCPTKPPPQPKPCPQPSKMPCHPSCGSNSRSQTYVTSSVSSADTTAESESGSEETEPEEVTSSTCDEDEMKTQLKIMLKKMEKLTCIVGEMNCELQCYNAQNHKHNDKDKLITD